MEGGYCKDAKTDVSQLQSLKGDCRHPPSQTTRESTWTHSRYPESKLEGDLTPTIEEVPSIPPQSSGLHEIVCFLCTILASTPLRTSWDPHRFLALCGSCYWLRLWGCIYALKHTLGNAPKVAFRLFIYYFFSGGKWAGSHLQVSLGERAALRFVPLHP